MPHQLPSADAHDIDQATEEPRKAPLDLLEVDIHSIPSPTLARLIDEVRNEENVSRSYNRSYHRHNR